MSSVGVVVSKNYLNWTDQRRYIPYAPLSPPSNITDLAGRLIAISDPIYTPSGNLIVAKISALGGNLYQVHIRGRHGLAFASPSPYL